MQLNLKRKTVKNVKTRRRNIFALTHTHTQTTLHLNIYFLARQAGVEDVKQERDVGKLTVAAGNYPFF